MRNRLINLHTSGETKPIGLLNPGEIAIQHSTPENSRIYIDTATDSTNSSEATIVEFVPKSYMDKEIQRVMELIGNSSGDTGNTGSTIDKSDYICDDPNANPKIYYICNSGTVNDLIITPCTHNFSNVGSLESFTFNYNLNKIKANFENICTHYNNFLQKYYLNEADLYLPNLTDGSNMFSGCSSLTSFTGDLSNLINGSNMFSGCTKLTSFTGDLSSLEYCEDMFMDCTNLLIFSSDLSSIGSAVYYQNNLMFRGCTGLTNVTLNGTLNCNRLSFSSSSKLTVDSLMNIINALVDRTGQNNYTIYLGSTNLAKLTDEQKAVATNKNWILA